MIRSKRYAGVYKNVLENKDISYYITYKLSNGKKEWFKMGLHSEGIRESYCSKYRANVMIKMRLGEDAPVGLNKKNNLTLDELSLEFFKYKDYKKASKRTFEGRYKNHIAPLLGQKDISLIKESDIKGLYQKIKEENLSDKTCELIISMCNTIFNYAINTKECLTKNPCRNIKTVKADNSRERFLTKAEVQELIRATKYDRDIYLFTLLSLSTGARLHDVYNIRKKDFNLDNRSVTIKNNKSNSTYQAFLNKRVLDVLDISELKVNDILYKVSERTIQRKMQRLLNKMFNEGLDKKDRKNRVVIHTLRHTFASHLAIAGTPIFTIQKLLNHKDIEQTLRYAKLSPDSGREFVEGLF